MAKRSFCELLESRRLLSTYSSTALPETIPFQSRTTRRPAFMSMAASFPLRA